MSIEIRQLSIKSNVLQQASGTDDQASCEKSDFGSSSELQVLTEETRNEILAECKSMLLDLLSRNRER
jgi:hypothetical protein